MPEQVAAHEWYTRALVRIIETTTVRNTDGGICTFHAEQEVEMVQWGRAGSPVDRSAWWDCFDIDGAYIITADKVEVIKVLREKSPL